MAEENKKLRNSEEFAKALEEKGLSYADIYYRLNGAGITEFNDILTKSGVIEKDDTGTYKGRRSFHVSDNGRRTPAETALDCEVGNIQERLFCLDNIDFKPNEKATNQKTEKDSDITTKELDLIHIPTGGQVEFKTSYGKMYGNVAYYHHRDGNFKEYIRSGKIIIVHFIKLDKVAILYKKYFEDPEMGKHKGSIRIKEEHVYSEDTGKYWDNVEVWSGIMFDYKMGQGNSEISRKISNLINFGK